MAASVRLHSTTGWQTYHDTEAGELFDLRHPTGWTVRSSMIECGVDYDLEALKLLVFETCWADQAGGRQLAFFETYQRFRDSFSGETAVTVRDVNGVRVQVVGYMAAGDNGVVVLDPGPGTVALWQNGI